MKEKKRKVTRTLLLKIKAMRIPHLKMREKEKKVRPKVMRKRLLLSNNTLRACNHTPLRSKQRSQRYDQFIVCTLN